MHIKNWIIENGILKEVDFDTFFAFDGKKFQAPEFAVMLGLFDSYRR